MEQGWSWLTDLKIIRKILDEDSDLRTNPLSTVSIVLYVKQTADKYTPFYMNYVFTQLI